MMPVYGPIENTSRGGGLERTCVSHDDFMIGEINDRVAAFERTGTDYASPYIRAKTYRTQSVTSDDDIRLSFPIATFTRLLPAD